MNIQNAKAAPLVSIIIPVYNTEKYLRECLDSVVNQTLRDIEIIVVNDASADGSQKIIDEYANKDPRIVSIVHEKNKRQGAARNTALAVCRGKYVMFLDSDDYFEAKTCEVAYEKIETHAVDFVEFGITRFRGNGKKWVEYSIEKEECRDDAFSEFLATRYSPSFCNKIFAARCFQKVRFLEAIYYEDEITMFMLAFSFTKFAKIPGISYLYRDTPNSTMSTPIEEKRVRDAIHIMAIMKNFLIDAKAYDAWKHALEEKYKFYYRTFLHSILYAALPNEKQQELLGMLTSGFSEDLLESRTCSDILAAEAITQRARHAQADAKLKQRKKIIAALFAYAALISLAGALCALYFAVN